MEEKKMKFYKGNNGLLLSLLNAESDLKEVRVGTVDASLEKHVPVVEVEGNKVREVLITSFKRAADTGIMTELEAADFVIYGKR
jgi:hypothetical protein